MAIKTRSARAKGIEWENYIADQIREKGLDPKAIRDGASGAGTREKADINTSVQIFGRNLGIEAKNHEKLNLPDWWRQVEKLETLGREPILIFKLPNRSPRIPLVTIYLDTFLDMLVALQGEDNVKSNVVETNNYDKVKHLRNLEYMKQNLSSAINDYKKKIINEN